MSQNIFTTVETTKPKQNYFDLSHDVKLSLKMGDMVPVMIQDVLPGDRFKISADTLLRFAPLVAPVMHKMDVSIHYWYIPNRLVWPNWDAWEAGKPGYTHPSCVIDKAFYDANPLFDYMGIPTLADGTTITINPLAFAAYQRVFNEWYRDQNLVAENTASLIDGGFTPETYPSLWKLNKRAWEHDYFTSALPFAQAGAPVAIPLGDVQLKPGYFDDPDKDQYPRMRNIFDGASPDGYVINSDDNGGQITTSPVPSPGVQAVYDPADSLEAGSTNISDLRRAFALQRYSEKLARFGRRVKEYLRGIWGVNSPDARLQLPEYITGVKTPVIISEIVNTTGQVTPEGDQPGLPQGNMAGHGVAVGTGKPKSFFCPEHGYIIGIMTVMPKTAYFQGLPRHFSRQDQTDYAIPDFAHIGEQPVFNKELYVDHDLPNGTFGYLPRYAEYRFAPNRVAGDFKTSLLHWHLARKFDTEPALNAQFINCDPTTRIFAVEDGTDYLYCQVLNNVSVLRSLPKFGSPI